MKKQRIKKIGSKIIGMMLPAFTVGSTISMVTYGSSKDIDWVATASTSGVTISTGIHSKLTTSSVFANYSSGNSSVLYATVWANWGTDTSTYTNVTLYTSAHPNYKLSKSSTTYVDILNTAHETYGDCYTQVRFTTNASGTHSGKWRPDY
jgi:hypothetical protein